MVAEKEEKPGQVEAPSVGDDSRRFITVARAAQFLFLAIFAFGVAWSISDLAIYFELPITGWALGCTVFGAEGVLASEFLVRRLEARLAASQ